MSTDAVLVAHAPVPPRFRGAGGVSGDPQVLSVPQAVCGEYPIRIFALIYVGRFSTY